MMSFVRLLQPSSRLAINHDGAALRRIETNSDSDAKKSFDGESNLVNKLGTETETTPYSDPMPGSRSSSSVSVDAYRLLALTERTSDLIKASESEVTRRADSLLNIFSAFANLLSVPFSTSMSIVPQDEFVETVAAHAAGTKADMLVIPWAAGASLHPEDDGPGVNRLESLFGQQAVERSPQYASFVRRIFLESDSDVGLFLDGGVSDSSPSSVSVSQHIYLPFHGGPDDRAALDFVMQLVANDPQMTATVTRLVKVAPDAASDSAGGRSPTNPAAASTSPEHGANQLTLGAGLGTQDTIYQGAANTQNRLASDTADNLAIARYFPAASSEGSAPPLLAHTAARVKFETIETSTPLKSSLSKLEKLVAVHYAVLVVAGRSRHSAPTHRLELEQYLKDRVVAGSGLSTLGIAASSDVRKTLGDIGSALVVCGEPKGVLILQSAVKGLAFAKGKGRKNV